jgi:hypothetical protein
MNVGCTTLRLSREEAHHRYGELVASVPTLCPGSWLARLEVAERTLVRVGEHVGEDRIETSLGEGEFDEAPLGGLEIKGL